ncbi:MAG: low temperature requirement protein A [Phormidesmis sp.]
MRQPAPDKPLPRSLLSLSSAQPPRLRIYDAEAGEPRHATWLELFYDLVFVVAVSQLAHKLSGEVSLSGFLGYAGLFIPLWWAWIGTTFYSNRFDSDDTIRRVMMGLQMLAIAALAVNIHHAWGESSLGFAISYIVSRVLLIVEYLRAAKHIPQARALIYPMTMGFTVGAALWIVSLWLPVPGRFWLWAAGLLVDFATPLLAANAQRQLPPHAEHLPERFGLFTIIVLGEAVIAVVNGVSEMSWTPNGVLSAVLSFVVAFSLWWLYFENSLGKAIEKARNTGRLLILQVWLYGHLPLVIGLAAAGIGVEHVLLSGQTQALPDNERWLIAGSVALCYVALAILHRTGLILSCLSRTRHRLGGAAAALAVAVFGTSLLPVAVVGAIAFIGIVQVLLDISQVRRPCA